MNRFTLTRFIFPLEDRVNILPSKKIYFDNLRNDKEIMFLSNYLKENWSLPEYFATIDRIAEEYIQYCKKNKLKYRDDLTGIDLLASLWVVINFEYNEEDRSKTMFTLNNEKLGLPEDSLNKLTFLNQNDSYLVSYKYSYLIGNFFGFLTNPYLNGSYSSNFIIFEDHNHFGNIEYNFEMILLFNSHSIIHLNNETDIFENEKNIYFPEIKNKVEKLSPFVDRLLLDSNRSKTLEYIISQLKIICEIRQEKVQWLFLCGIVELLLTHNPDFNRFNVEDSISKQFKMKLGIVLSRGAIDFDYHQMERKLKDIYKIRSMLAHGDFFGLDKFLDSSIKKSVHKYSEEEDDDELFNSDPKDLLFEKLLFDLFDIVQELIIYYLENPEYVDYLKRN